jgi:hypothetical protein
VDLITVKIAKESKETPAKCALCGGNHLAKYKGCEHYRHLIKRNNKFRNNTQRTPPINNNNIYMHTYRKNINIVLTLNNKEVTQMLSKVTQVRSKTRPSH